MFQSELQILKMKRQEERERSRFHGNKLECGELGSLSFLVEKESIEFYTLRGKTSFYHGHMTYTDSLLLLSKMLCFKRPSETLIIGQVRCHTFNARTWAVEAGGFLLVPCQPYVVRACFKKEVIL